MKSTLKKLLRSECVMTQDVDRLARLMSTYVNVQYSDERVPNIDMKSMAQEAVEEFRGDKKGKKGSVRGGHRQTVSVKKLETVTAVHLVLLPMSRTMEKGKAELRLCQKLLRI